MTGAGPRVVRPQPLPSFLSCLNRARQLLPYPVGKLWVDCRGGRFGRVSEKVESAADAMVGAPGVALRLIARPAPVVHQELVQNGELGGECRPWYCGVQLKQRHRDSRTVGLAKPVPPATESRACRPSMQNERNANIDGYDGAASISYKPRTGSRAQPNAPERRILLHVGGQVLLGGHTRCARCDGHRQH